MQSLENRFQQKNVVNKKVANEEQAIGSQIKRYKQNYLNKAIQSNNLQTFVRFSKQLFLLVISHCKNIVCIAPDKITANLQEISILFDDIINKYHQSSLKLHDRFTEICKNDNKTNIASEVCSVCSQQIKKVHIDQMKRSIFNESHIIQKENCEPKEQQQDLQFFAELNDLLNHSHGQILRNQIEIDLYQDVALNALKSLSSLKSYFSRDSVLIPNINWIEEAKQEMQSMLRQNFNGKIPPWIEKMFALFWALHRKETLSKQKQQGVQTVNNANTQILQLKKKVYRSNEKLEKTQQKILNQEHEITNMVFEKKDLQIRVDYYKKELNKLIDQIEGIKSQNQMIKMKLSSHFGKRESENLTKTQISYYEMDNIMMESSHDKKRTIERQNSLPKLLKSSDQKRPKSKKRESQTSIKMFPLGQSQYKTQRDTANLRKKQHSKRSSQQTVNKQNEQASRTQPNSPSGIRDYHNQNLKDTIIQQEEGQTLLEQEKKKITEVSEHIKNMVKSKVHKNGFKHYFSNSVTSDTFKDSLRRVPRKTNKLSENMNDKAKGQKQSIYRNIDESTLKAQKISSALIKIYHYLRDEGYLIKLTQQQFKQSIAKIDLIDMGNISLDQYRKALQARLSTHNTSFQRYSTNRKSWNQQTFHIEKEVNEECQKYQQCLCSRYFSIFSNQQNAYNYEISLTKNHYKGIYKMSKLQEKLCEQFFEILTGIKANNFEHYKFLCSYLRYPYQVMKNDFGVVNMVNEMKFENFHQYFQRLLGIHIRCKKQEGLCQHFIELKVNMMKNIQINSIDK